MIQHRYAQELATANLPIMRLLIFLFPIIFVSTMSFGQTLKKAETAVLEDCSMYYEVYGDGEPLFFLHGFFGSSKYWMPYVSEFSDEYEVYLVDLTGHGNSSSFKHEISIPEAVSNLYSLVQYLGLKNIKAVGYSYGGDVLFHLAANYPDIVKSMITIGGLGTHDVSKAPVLLEKFSYKNIDKLDWLELYQPNASQAKWLLDHLHSYIVYLSDESCARIKSNTLIILGDDDGIPLSEVDKVRNLLSSSDLWILPNTGHNAHEGKNKAEFIRVSKEFLKRDSKFDQNEGIIIHPYESDIMSGYPPTDSNLVTLVNWDLAPFNRWAYQHFRELVPTQNISRGNGPTLNLPRNPRNIDDLTFEDKDGKMLTVKEMLATTFTDGFIVIKDGQVITEQYFTGMQPSSLHLLMSGSKSLIIALFAALMSTGEVNPASTVKDYVPELANCGYADARLSHLMDMLSGVQYSMDWNDSGSESYRHGSAFLWGPRSAVDSGQRDFLKTTKKTKPHGVMFSYKDSETEVLSWVMEKSRNCSFAELFSKLIWSEIGAEYDAYISCDGLGSPVTCGGFNVSLRDFARFGLMFLNAGSVNGKQIIPASFVRDITETANPDFFANGPWAEGFPPGTAYNDHFWLPGGHEGAYMAYGHAGQYLYIHPKYNVVIGKFSTYPHDVDDLYLTDTDWRGFYAISKAL